MYYALSDFAKAKPPSHSIEQQAGSFPPPLRERYLLENDLPVATWYVGSQLISYPPRHSSRAIQGLVGSKTTRIHQEDGLLTGANLFADRARSGIQSIRFAYNNYFTSPPGAGIQFEYTLISTVYNFARLIPATLKKLLRSNQPGPKFRPQCERTESHRLLSSRPLSPAALQRRTTILTLARKAKTRRRRVLYRYQLRRSDLLRLCPTSIPGSWGNGHPNPRSLSRCAGGRC